MKFCSKYYFFARFLFQSNLNQTCTDVQNNIMDKEEISYLVLGFSSDPSLNHLALGLGLPVYGTFTKMSSPLLTVTPSSNCGAYPTLGGPEGGNVTMS